jgi:hypothetical protein
MVFVDGAGTPLGAYLDAASPAEVTLLEATLDTVAVGPPGKPGRPRKRPERLIGAPGYDSNPLRARLAGRGIEPIIPARGNNRRATPTKVGVSCDGIERGGWWNARSPG